MHLLKDSLNSTFKKITIITIIFVILTTSTFVLYIIPRINTTLMDQRKQLLHEMSYLIVDILYQLDNRAKIGSISEDEAKIMAIKIIEDFRYGKNNDDYFWINEIDSGTMIAHPLTELLGDNLESYTDIDGYNFGADMLNITRKNEEGYVTYKWVSKTDPDEYVPKISHVMPFEPWGWMLGTGMYVDDVQKEVSMITQRIISTFILILFLMVGLLIFIIRAGAKIEKQRNTVQLEFMSLIQHLPIGVFRIEIENNRKNETLILWNDALKKLLEIPDENSSWKKSFQLSSILKNKNDRDIIINNLFTHGFIMGEEYELQTAKNKTLWIKLYGKLIEKNGKTFLDASVENITEKHKAHELTERSYAELKKIDKMKDEIISITSHELRTPLTIIKGFASILLHEEFGSLNDQQKKHISKIQCNTDHLLEMITNMLDLEKLENNKMQIKFEKVDLNHIIMDIHDDFHIRCKKEQKKIIIKLNKSPQMIKTDPLQMKRILINLVDNALKNTKEENGMIHIFTKEIESDKIEIHVKDNGVGIAKHDLKDIFEKFKQVGGHMRRISGGSGMGLPIVKRLITELGGTIHVKSELKKGSDFYVTIPRIK